MRVLHVVTDMRIANGIMSVVLNYAKHMPSDIVFDVAYFKDFPENRKKDIEMLGGKVYKLSTPGIKSFFKSDWDEFFKLHADEYTAVHIHAPHLACMIAPKAKKCRIKKIAVHCHSTWYSLFKKNKLRNHLLSIYAKHSDIKRFACGRDAGRFWYGKDSNFTVLPNAIDCSAYRFNTETREKKRQELGIENCFVVGHVGRVSPPQKNHPFLIEIFAEIYKQNKNAVLLMVGADETDELKCLAEKLGIYDKLRFLGQQNDVAELLQTMDVFVFPSFYEGLPVSVVEAQAVGLPVLMSDSVTDEVCITKHIMLKPLNEIALDWAIDAIRIGKCKHEDAYEIMKKSGWDINETAKKIEKFYKEGLA